MIVNPLLFYVMNVCSCLKLLSSIMAIVTGIIFCGLGCFYVAAMIDEAELNKSLETVTKWTFFLFILFELMRCVTTEYVPLGVFIGERPEKLRTRLIELNAYDNMVKFDREAEGFFDSLTYPITLRAYFEALCAYCGVVPATMTRFINGDKTFTSAPINTNGLTCRDVLAYLAEAACSYARMNRDGECELAWYADAGYTVNRTDRFALDRSEYEVTRIDRTQVKVTENDIGVLVGSGNNGYTIVDCPFLYGMSDADVRPWAENIHNELVLIETYTPMTVDAECDWRVQCGDIITVEEDDGTLYKTPVFVQTITWNGHANVTYESTGRVALVHLKN